MPLLRSLFFDLVFYVWAFFVSLACYIVARVTGRGDVLRAWGKIWQQGGAFLEKHLLGLDYTLTGRENLPPAPYIVAMQHQSAWETMKLLLWFDNPAIVLKAELLDLPLWGYAMRTYGAIPVDRSRKADDLKRMLDAASAMAKAGRPIIIFPQGTRTKPGVKKPLQRGVGVLYDHLKIPVVPVTLNSGEFWGKKAFLKSPGTVTVTIHPPIPPGLSREEMMERVEGVIYKG